ncbi:metal-dependent transcriptional regulator [Gordonia jinghuaiqii]|nr:metal-dependent transcriptional regulator [Gordonia jinghuaiqii]
MTELSQVTQDYLKVIWTSQEWEDVKVTTKLLAQSLGVSASTASEAIRKLADQGLVSHEPYGAVTLTEEGRAAAILMVRRHRLLETFLVRELGYRWDEVHDEAEVLEHAVSDRLMARLDAKLGFPDRDPHGDPIPALDGSIPAPAAALLADLEVGASGSIARISDTDPEMLRYFDQVGVALDCVVTVAEKRPFAGTISVSLGDADPIDLGDIAARAIFVVPRS